MAFKPIPSRCPKCGEYDGWKEVINIFTSGIPISENVRISIFKTGGFSFRIRYRCEKCGFTDKYNPKDQYNDLRNM